MSRLIAAGGLLVGSAVLPAFTAPAAAYTDPGGTITAPAPAGNGSTDLEFSLRCPTAPASQGVNGWVFTLPSLAAGTVVGVTGSDSQDLHDLSAYVYKSDCTYDRVVTYPGGDLYVTLDAGDAYLSVFTANGANTSVSLTAPATPPSGTGPNDPLYAQNGEDDLLLAGQWNMRKVNATAAWTVATGSGIKVADLDSGLDLTHPDFACTGKVTVVPGANLVGSGSPEDDNGHGTHTAGIIGACTNNGVGVVGIAPDSEILPFKVLDANGSGNATQLATAIHRATDAGAHVINMSIGFSVQGAPYTGSVLGYLGGLPDIDEAVSYARSKGVVVVASAGNESAGLCSYPALALNVVCVGSSDPRDLNTYYGNFPVKDDDSDLVGPGLLAPGGTGQQLFCDFSSEDVLSTYARSVDTAEGNCDQLLGYASFAGTSMAAPLVSGAAALVYDKLGGTRSTANADKVVEALIGSAKDLYTPGYDPMSGYGRLDAAAAVSYWP